jgi:hypothetical protein
MGIAEIDLFHKRLVISSHIITYGSSADEVVTESIRDEIETMWNEPKGSLLLNGTRLQVVFTISAAFAPAITELEVIQNTDPRNNYFRIEEFINGNISFVDGLGCNSGYFKLENLYKGSTTAAHEYGHTLGLDHPKILDIRGKGRPGIMYPRGTLVDPPFQYDPAKPAGLTGGTMHPMYRKVLQEDIDQLKIHKLRFRGNTAILGAFSNVYHFKHLEGETDDFMPPPVAG